MTSCLSAALFHSNGHDALARLLVAALPTAVAPSLCLTRDSWRSGLIFQASRGLHSANLLSFPKARVTVSSAPSLQ